MTETEVLKIDGPDGIRDVKLTSALKVLWPDRGVTKRGLVEYLLTVAEPFLHLNGDRPMTLQRFPEGIDGEEFFSKRPPRGAPDFLETVMCTYPSRRRHLQLVFDEPADLAWAAQMGTITFHPWPVRTANLDNPDELRIDLDPQPGRDFKDAVEAAVALRELMAEVGLKAYAKTSGNRGVHVYARIKPTHEFQDVRHGVIGIARELERRLPDLVTSSWWKEERGERVFVDFNQANRDRTIAAAYSPRPLPGAPVSTPLTWDELVEAQPSDFTVLTVPPLLEQRPCPWSDIDDDPGDVTGALALWEADLQRGLGELNFPPDYPKMPGEPPRVPPSKRRTDRADDEYLAPKAERDAGWGTAIAPPYGPMLAKPVKKLPEGDFLYEPKWDGFRSIIWRSGDQVEIGSRNSRPMTRYFPELVEAIIDNFPDHSAIDGEIIMVDPTTGDRLNFDTLQQRIHPAASRIEKLARETPASFVAFDLLALGQNNFVEKPFRERRAALEEALAHAEPPIYLTRATDDPDVAREWFEEFEGAGLDGVIAKSLDEPYVEDKRVMYKLKHERTADCVVAGYRLYKDEADAIGSLLLGLYTDDGQLNSVGVIGALPMARRKELFEELQPLVTTFDDHPWAWAQPEETTPDNRDQSTPRTPTSAAHSRWNAKKDLSFVPLRPERVVEVRYDHMEGDRFRHTAQWVGWREDRDPESCTYDQLEEPVSYDLTEVLRGPDV
ncbi:ATP-dependent DNA ligase [Tessaracoccus flavus]|uniref:DNA ligase (ATP) n=1 Tax=Tessaracoccus flavus TaxID=1610493 RepID=A0A1Q2CHU6_9ACTN|nr:ATP-dependent DNA ligase [Tessaracoccus flavus]AQP45635.1 DNA ligase [Tessaracoccus flavus]SDY76642.1 DNA ligase D [Tessaracoccus flavus]